MSAPSSVQAVLWDADGVLQRHGEDWQAEYGTATGPGDAADDDFLAEAWAVEKPLMVGGDFPTALAEVARRRGIETPVEILLSRWRSIEPLDDTWDVVREVRELGVRCFLATNQQPYRGAHMQTTLGYDDRLDGAFYSFELGVAKPDPAYFRAVLAELDLPAEQVLFLDDRADNVEAARFVGLRAERWEHGDGVAELRALLGRHEVLDTA